MPNEQYQSLFGLAGDALRKQFLDGAPEASTTSSPTCPTTATLAALVHRPRRPRPRGAARGLPRSATRSTDRPSVVFAYTVKGWGLPIAGNPRNHSALLSGEQIDALRASIGLDAGDRVGPLRPGVTGRRAGAASRRERAAPGRRGRRPCPSTVPESTRQRAGASRSSTQEVFGRVLVDLARDEAGRAVPRHHRARRRHVDQPRRLHQQDRRVRADPAPRPGTRTACCAGPRGRAASTSSSASSEMNLFLLLGQLGLAWDLSGAAAAAGRHRVRPVRAARPRRLHLRHVLGVAVRRRRHAVGGDARARGRGAPVDDHARRSAWSCPA